MKLSEVAYKINGTLVGGDREISDFQTDSRKCKENSLFFTLKGNKHDGHEFLHDVYKVGGMAIVEKKTNFVPHIEVENSLKSLTSLAFSKIKNSLRIAVTGSCGKTTTKDMIAFLLQQHGRVVKTRGNLNTDVGISLSILNAQEDAPQYAVLEMGARFVGDVKYLAKIFRPHISLITCVGSAHSKYIDPIVEKSSIAEETEKFVLFNDEKLEKLLGGKGKKSKKYVKNVVYDGLNTIVEIDGKRYSLKGIWGEGQISDLELSLSLMDELGLSYDVEEMSHFIFPQNRMHVEKIGDFVLINDTYNSNLESMENAAKVAWKLSQGRSVWVLAPMEEIENSYVMEKMHALREKYDPKIIFNVKEGFYPFGEAFSIKKLKSSLETGMVILVKGSRVYELEKIAEEIKDAIT